MTDRQPALSLRLLIHLLLLRPLLRLVFGVNVVGRENLKGLDRFILAANHNSHLDTLLLFSVLPIRQILRTHPLAARDYFSKQRWLFAAVDYLFRPIWIDRVRKEGDPIEETLEKIDRGSNIIIFPEGTRGEPGQIQEFRTGIGRVVERRRDLPVVPVFLLGPERSLPKRARFPLPLWNYVIVGLPQLLKGETRDVTRSLQKSIENLALSESAQRHRRRPAKKQCFTIGVLGIDGSGKSTLSRRLALELSHSTGVGLISDSLELFEDLSPKELQPLLVEKARQWIGAQAKQARSLVRYKIPKLTELLLRDRMLDETLRWYRPDIIVMDGCPLLNMTGWATLYREQHFNEDFCAKAVRILSSGAEGLHTDDPVLRNFPELRYLKRLKLDRLHIPDAIIFVDVDPKVAIRRIESRGGRRQVHETEEKLDKLRAAYLMVCRVIERDHEVPVCRIDAERSIDVVASEALSFIELARAESRGH
ncbi:MAG: 1-acyl-sn-glycerol-3-phosphate acyltransferase [Gemmatimonadota bacterium]|nr:MAG: 1-acyl-sn-glycerol-3-phosphate acyltransferase [Gemmatimonadota bacterium]